MPVKLNSSDKKIITLAVIVAAASLLFAVRYFSRAFPEASLTLKVNRGESQNIAGQFLAARGFNVAGYKHAAMFNYDDTAKLYLERSLGLARMNRLTRGPIHLWRWSHRWFKPLQIEEFDVDVTPAGQVVGFDHILPEAAPGANLSQAGARIIAENFLTDVMHRNPATLDFVEAVTTKRAARTDHTFIWKEKGLKLGDGSFRIKVDIAGSQVAGYSEYVHIPDAWLRSYHRLRAKNDDAQLVDQVFYFLLILAMAGLLIRRLRDRDIPWRLAFIFGAVAGVLYLLSQLNEYPLELYSYSTTVSYSTFMARYLYEAVLSAAGIGVAIFLLVAAAEPAYREGFPRLPSIRRTLSWRGLRSRPFFIANVIGIALAIFFFAYQTLFYLLANHFGAWAPSDIPFSNQLNTSIPWAAVLFIGFFPAVNEELTFRAFAIPFIRKHTRSLSLAIVASAFIWSFLHSVYPNEPFFIRGLEVGIGGIIVGLIMLRFGIIATMIWHYSVDALYTAFLLLRSQNLYLRVSGGVTAGIMLIPLGVALVAYLRSGSFSDEESLTNRSEGISRAPEAPAAVDVETPVEYHSLSRSRLFLAGGVIVVFAALAVIPAYRFGEGIKLRISRPEAVRIATQFLQSQGVHPASYDHVAWLDENVDPSVLRYLLQRQAVEAADRTYRQATQLELWAVRFFRPLHKEEYFVFVDPMDGKVFTFRHVIAEDAPGASLSPQAAQAVAEKAFVEQGYRLNDFNLQSSHAEKRKAREDYEFVWQAKQGDSRNVGKALYRVIVSLAGDQVMSVSRYFKLPQQWVRSREGLKLGNIVLIVVSSFFGIAFFAGFILLLVRYARRGAIRWGRSAIVAAVVGILYGLNELNVLPLIDREYQTSISLVAFRIEVGASLIIVPILLGALALLVVGVATVCYPNALRVFSRSARKTWRRDAFVAAAVAIAAEFGWAKLATLFEDRFHAVAPVNYAIVSSSFQSYLPGADVWISALTLGVFAVSLIGVVIALASEGWAKRAWWLWLAGLFLLAALGPQTAHSAGEYWAGWLMHFVPLAFAGLFVWLFFRDNILAYLTAYFVLAVAGSAAELLWQPATVYRWNGVLLVILSLATLAWLLLPGRASSTAESPQP